MKPGHFDYKYLRFQAIDTPGILDHPLEEVRAFTLYDIRGFSRCGDAIQLSISGANSFGPDDNDRDAICDSVRILIYPLLLDILTSFRIAHIRSSILFFIDISEHCGYSVDAQIQLLSNIKPLFANKLLTVVLSKIDLKRLEDLDPETREKLESLVKPGEVELLQLSCTTSEGVTAVKNAVCERLIAERVAQKLKSGSSSNGVVGGRLGEVLARIHVAQPIGGRTREPYIPEAVKRLSKLDKDNPRRRRLAREIEEMEGGAGVYNVDLKRNYLLPEEQKHDKVPEILDGRNVAGKQYAKQ